MKKIYQTKSPTPGRIAIICNNTVQINLFVLLSEGSNSSQSIYARCVYLMTSVCFSGEILVDGDIAGTAAAAVSAGDPGAVTRYAPSLSVSSSICVRSGHGALSWAGHHGLLGPLELVVASRATAFSVKTY